MRVGTPCRQASRARNFSPYNRLLKIPSALSSVLALEASMTSWLHGPIDRANNANDYQGNILSKLGKLN